MINHNSGIAAVVGSPIVSDNLFGASRIVIVDLAKVYFDTLARSPTQYLWPESSVCATVDL